MSDNPLELRASGVTMDCADVARMADFWQAALGFRSRAGDERTAVTLSDAAAPRVMNHLTLQKVPEGKTAKHRVHLDLFPADGQRARDRLVELGATVLRQPTDGEPGHFGFQAIVMQDPEGGEFCLVVRPPKAEQG
ncbi:MAG: VOC family protein [Acidimicrobiales bacterium]